MRLPEPGRTQTNSTAWHDSSRHAQTPHTLGHTQARAASAHCSICTMQRPHNTPQCTQAMQDANTPQPRASVQPARAQQQHRPGARLCATTGEGVPVRQMRPPRIFGRGAEQHIFGPHHIHPRSGPLQHMALCVSRAGSSLGAASPNPCQPSHLQRTPQCLALIPSLTHTRNAKTPRKQNPHGQQPHFDFSHRHTDKQTDGQTALTAPAQEQGAADLGVQPQTDRCPPCNTTQETHVSDSQVLLNASNTP
jgi:hypothetical protein